MLTSVFVLLFRRVRLSSDRFNFMSPAGRSSRKRIVFRRETTPAAMSGPNFSTGVENSGRGRQLAINRTKNGTIIALFCLHRRDSSALDRLTSRPKGDRACTRETSGRSPPIKRKNRHHLHVPKYPTNTTITADGRIKRRANKRAAAVSVNHDVRVSATMAN